jgi:hypothetical protein
LPTSGFVGSFDAKCHQDGTCDGEEPGLLGKYFSRVNAFGVVMFSASYVGEVGCGTWTPGEDPKLGEVRAVHAQPHTEPHLRDVSKSLPVLPLPSLGFFRGVQISGTGWDVRDFAAPRS